MNHNKKIIIDFKTAIIIADNKINELRNNIKLNDNRKKFYYSAVKIGNIVKGIYCAFDKNNLEILPKLNTLYGKHMIVTLDILENLVKRNIMTENEYLLYAKAFKERKEEYDELCYYPKKIKGIPLCLCCIK